MNYFCKPSHSLMLLMSYADLLSSFITFEVAHRPDWCIVGADFFLLLQQKLLEELAGARLLGIGK